MSEYFFELLTEEIPASMHEGAQSAMREKLSQLVEQIGGNPSAMVVTTTSRRLVFFLPSLPEKEEDREQEVKGPPRKAAFDAEGKPTAALHGFLKKNNASIDDVQSGGDYVQVRRRITGRATAEILGERIPSIVESLRWPKMMRWGNGERSYIRPVHSVISVFDGQPLPIEIFGIASGVATTGHRTLGRGRIEVTSYTDYVTRLELASVVVDATRRLHVMAERARVLASEVGGTPALDPATWAQWQYLTEYPGVVRAEFRSDFLQLPEEVLVTVMRVHQKQLPIRDAKDRLTNSFLAVLDNEADRDGNAAYGNAFVTNARFADAQFFHQTDRKRPLADRMEQLTHLQFQEKLGDYRAKTARIVRIATAICASAGLDPADATEAAAICKTDLVTEMVKEFTDLQGKVGGIYAHEEGRSEPVWQAVYDHYLPVNIDDELPRGTAGAVVSLADRADTLAGFFSIGLKPTGSRDPFALRRAAQGVVQILLNRDKRQVKIGIAELVDLAFAAQEGPRSSAAETAREDLLAFFAERVRTLLEASRYEFAYDEIAAAMEAGWARSLPDLVDRIHAIRSIRDEKDFLSLLDSAKRIANITAGQPERAVNPALLTEPSEKRLHELSETVSAQIGELVAERHYVDALRSFARLAPELEAFFRDVMVMVDDSAMRDNRIALLRNVQGMVLNIADVTKIVVDRRDYRT